MEIPVRKSFIISRLIKKLSEEHTYTKHFLPYLLQFELNFTFEPMDHMLVLLVFIALY